MTSPSPDRGPIDELQARSAENQKCPRIRPSVFVWNRGDVEMRCRRLQIREDSKKGGRQRQVFFGHVKYLTHKGRTNVVGSAFDLIRQVRNDLTELIL